MSGMTVRRASRDCRGAMKMTPVLQSETGVIFSFCILFKDGTGVEILEKSQPAVWCLFGYVMLLRRFESRQCGAVSFKNGTL